MPVGKKAGGRQKGTPNKVTATVKNEILAVYEMVGGRQGMARWARQRPSEFYAIYCRLAPKEIVAAVEVNNVHNMTRDDIEALLISSGVDPKLLEKIS